MNTLTFIGFSIETSTGSPAISSGEALRLSTLFAMDPNDKKKNKKTFPPSSGNYAVELNFLHLVNFFQIWSTVAGYDELSVRF